MSEPRKLRVEPQFIRIAREYFEKVRPLLRRRTHETYEALLLDCDGWDRPTSAARIAHHVRTDWSHIKKEIRFIEAIGLIESVWRGARTSPHPQRAIRFLHDYDAVAKRLGEVTGGRNRPQSRGRNGPHPSLARSSMEISGRSSLRSITETPSFLGAGGAERRKEGVRKVQRSNVQSKVTAVQVPDELVTRARHYWPNEGSSVLRSNLGRLLGAGFTVPLALKWLGECSKDPTMARADRPFFVACHPERYEPWLEKTLKALARAQQRQREEAPIEPAVPKVAKAPWLEKYERRRGGR